jgi:hypothetical protein
MPTNINFALHMACQQAQAWLDAHYAPLPASHMLQTRCQPQKVPWPGSRPSDVLNREVRDVQ